jgi:alanine racemase
MKAWVEVSEERLRANFRTICEIAGIPTEVLAVVKANAYGHGAERCAAALARADAKWFGVADVNEGACVRRVLNQAGFRDARILVMCGLAPEDVAGALQYDLIPVVWTPEQVRLLQGHTGMRVHVEIDSGMGRQGCRPGTELDAILDALGGTKLELDGLMTHFCAAEVVGAEKTRTQRVAFEAAVAQVRARGMQVAWVHAGSSSTVDDPTWDASWLPKLAASVGAKAMVRCGIALYGYCNPLEGTAGRAPRLSPKLHPVMMWKTRVLDVREMCAGESVGYNAMFTAKSDMRVALLPVGYADGLRRSLSSTDNHSGGWVIVRGQRAPILGRISMNLTTVDVTEIAGVRVGDDVVLLGDGVTADDRARIEGTISYEILCGVRAESTSCC